MQQIKGAVLKTRLAFVEEKFGATGLAELLDGMSPDDQAVLKSILTVKWYPFALGRRLDDAIVRSCGKGDPDYFRKLGVASADKNLAGVHKSFLTQGDPHAFLAKAKVIYGMYYETGRREYQKTGDKSAVLTTFDAETFSAPDCLTVIGWHERALEMCGATGVSIVEEECRARGGAVCRYKVTWG